MRGVARLAVLLLACFGTVAAADELRPAIRIISINMCTDQLLLDLATPAQIAGLSPFARDAARRPRATMSWRSSRSDL